MNIHRRHGAQSYQERVLCTSPRNTKPRRVREGQDMRKNKLEKVSSSGLAVEHPALGANGRRFQPTTP